MWSQVVVADEAVALRVSPVVDVLARANGGSVRRHVAGFLRQRVELLGRLLWRRFFGSVHVFCRHVHDLACRNVFVCARDWNVSVSECECECV